MKPSSIPARATTPRVRYGAAGLLLLLAGAAAGAGAVELTRPAVQMAPISPTPIARLANSTGIVSVRGKVTDRFGNRFLLQDATGHVLVDAGPNAAWLDTGAPITVQGRFERGELHARFLVDASDHVLEVAPPPPAPPPPPGAGPVPLPPPLPGGPAGMPPAPDAALLSPPQPPGSVGMPPAGSSAPGTSSLPASPPPPAPVVPATPGAG